MPNPDKYINLTELGRFKTKILNEISNSYLGKTATAADSSKLNGQSASYYLNYNNLSNKPSIPTESTVSGWGFTKLTIGTTASTAAAGNHNHDATYLPLVDGGEIQSGNGNGVLLTLYNKNNSGQSFTRSTWIRFKFDGQETARWLIGAEAADGGFYFYKEYNSTNSKVLWLDQRDDSLHTSGDIYENGTALSNKYYSINNPNGYTSNTGTVIGSGLTANNIILGNGGVNIKTSSYTIAPSSTTWSDSDDTKLPTMKSIAAKIASGGGGTTKYTHNIVMQWSGGSTYNYRGGSISFSFQDSNPNSYATNGYTEDESDIMDFFKDHCGMANHIREFKKFPVNGSVAVGWPVTELWFITSICNPGFDMWYVGGGAIQVNSSKAITGISSSIDEINYLSSMLNGQPVRIYDNVI